MSALRPHWSLLGVVSLMISVYLVRVLIRAWRNGVIDDGEMWRYTRSGRPLAFWFLFVLYTAAMASAWVFGIALVFGNGD